MEKNKILLIPDVMERLHMSYRTVVALCRTGVLPASKMGPGHKWLIQSKDLYAMLEAHKRAAPGDKEGRP